MYSHWCFTLFDEDTNSPGPFDEELVRYCVFQLETCPKTGRLHWQGYVELHRDYRLAGVQKAIGVPKGTHMERRKGTREQARAYCMKAESRTVGPDYLVGPFEFGRWELKPGRRSDLQAAAECKTINEVKTYYASTYVKYYRGLEKLIVAEQDIDFKPTVCVLWGRGIDTGKGHSWKKFKKKYSLSHYFKDTSQWWDGYCGQELCVIEEFNPQEQKWTTASSFKNLFSHGTDYVYQKGNTRHQFLSKMVIITSNYDPKEWFPQENWSRINKRIKSIVHCGDVDGKEGDWVKNIEDCFAGLLPEQTDSEPVDKPTPCPTPISVQSEPVQYDEEDNIDADWEDFL